MKFLFRYLDRICQIDIIKVFSLTALSTLVRILTGFISVKFMAVIIGASGIALLGQLNNFSTIILSVATLGINSGVTKYVAEFQGNESRIKLFLSTGLKIVVVSSLICGILMIIFCHLLSKWIFLAPDYAYVFIVFGITIILYSLNNFFISILNGFKEYKKFVIINIVGTIVGLVFTLILIIFFQLKGALISSVTFQSVSFFFTFRMLRKYSWRTAPYFKQKFEFLIAKKYLRYSLMTLVSVSVVPVSQLLLRGYVMNHISEIEAGWWEAMNRISGMYLLIITSSFSVYYLPRLSEIIDRSVLKKEIFRSYKIIIPMLFFGFIVIYFLRHFIIKLLFTVDFMPMTELFKWQLLGDFFKMSSWILAYLMLAKSMISFYIFTELISSALYVGLAFILMDLNGIIGITQAYFINYVIYMLIMILIFRKLLFKNETIVDYYAKK